MLQLIRLNVFAGMKNNYFKRRLLCTVPEPKVGKRSTNNTSQSGKGNTRKIFAVVGTCAVSSCLIYGINEYPNSNIGKFYYQSWVYIALRDVRDSLFGNFVKEIFEPTSDKLLPDWPTAPCYANIAPGTPAPPLLVLDVERTLIGSTYDAKHGWRHVKRPGVDKFLKNLSQYYEIVLFSENDLGVAQEILLALDPEGFCHKLGSSAAEIRGEVVVKRLDYMNREIGRIILIDDNPESFQLFPRNTIHIRPFTNVNDKTDTVLTDLIPVLQAMVHDEVQDFRDTLDDLGTHDAEEVSTEYKMRLYGKKVEELKKRNKGLGGLLRNPPNLSELDDGSARSTILSPSQIVNSTNGLASLPNSSIVQTGTGSSATSTQSEKKKGGMMEWLEKNQKSYKELENAKRQKMEEVYRKKMVEKQRLEDERSITKVQKDSDDDL
eukprot:gene6428-8846_t